MPLWTQFTARLVGNEQECVLPHVETEQSSLTAAGLGEHWQGTQWSCAIFPLSTHWVAADATELRHEGGEGATRPRGLSLVSSLGLGPWLPLPRPREQVSPHSPTLQLSVYFPCSQPYIVCRQCPEYRRQAAQPLPCPGPGPEPGSLQAPSDTPSTSTSTTTGEKMCHPRCQTPALAVG